MCVTMDTATSIDVHTDSDLDISMGTVGSKKCGYKGKYDMICLLLVRVSLCVFHFTRQAD